MNTLILSIFILVLLELLEAWWQRSDTMMGVLVNGYHYYKKSIFLFLLMHPSFYFVLLVILATNILNGWIAAIIILKSLDIILKITMMQNLFVKDNVDEILRSFLREPLTPWVFLTGVSLYPFLLYYALS